MNNLNSMNFTIAVVPDSMSINQDMRFIKAALLYSDTITLVSPMASTYFQLTDKAYNKNEKTLFELIKKVMPFCKKSDPLYYESIIGTFNKMESILYSKQYKTIPVVDRYRLKKTLLEFSDNVSQVFYQSLGEDNCNSLKKLVEINKVKLHDFRNSYAEADAFCHEFYTILKDSVVDTQTFPLFDDLSNNLIKSAINDGVVILNDANEFEAKHAKLASELLVSLPTFEFATLDEILDIRKELEKPLIRFRNKLFSYNTKIQSMPWDKNFQFESMKLYQEEVAVSVLEIEESIKETSFIKNLGYSILTDESAIKKTGELFMTIAMAGAITSFSDVLSSGQALLTMGGAYVIPKIAKAFNEHKNRQNEICKKDMYFYYKAGKLLEESRR